MIRCHACKGKQINNEVLGLSQAQASELHNAVHQREAVYAAIDKLKRLADEAESSGWTGTAFKLHRLRVSRHNERCNVASFK